MNSKKAKMLRKEVGYVDVDDFRNNRKYFKHNKVGMTVCDERWQHYKKLKKENTI